MHLLKNFITYITLSEQSPVVADEVPVKKKPA